ncbi:4'-phosphopantetheinyl transferase superfamily protein [Vibrio sp. T187]|uniref:4'-phosphopantetheinyl transferase family protein n=1 Tax=Vibrio TaxID=662 RepID=UPI0010C9CCD0|nr:MULTISPECIES: 4'-phosphopantetheinyl transferase superfamily protein [Vibrio]MBW3694973.1 4'-phosphopantetheinyl transferase superfamily protein [Vibrio sp. T187]
MKSNSPLSNNSREFVKAPISVPLLIEGNCIEALLVEFNPNHYFDELFEAFDIHLPDSIKVAVTQRKAEFLAGRHLAGKVMDKHGLGRPRLPINADRRPKWPSQFTGSISHSKNLAVACGVLPDDPMELGIDVQHKIDESVVKDIKAMVADDEELHLMRAFGLAEELAITLLFSAKESIYKAISNKTTSLLDFHSVSLIDIDNHALTFTSNIKLNLSGHSLDTIHCQYQYLEQYQSCLTFCYVKY